MPDFERVEPNDRIIWKKDRGYYTLEKVIINTMALSSVPAFVLVPKSNGNKQLPAVLAIHGHGGKRYGKVLVAGEDRRDPDIRKTIKVHNYDYGRRLAEEGYLAICPDLWGFGERSNGFDAYPGRDGCNVFFLKAMLLGLNPLALNLWDMMRTIDYLQGRDDVDGRRIGAVGLSYGGTIALFLSALDQRVKATVVSCYLNTFGSYALGLGNTCGMQTVPDLLKYAEMSDIASLIAPRPLLFESGARDPGFPVARALESYRRIRKVYEVAGAANKLGIDIFQGGHKFSGRKSLQWLREWL